MGYEGDFPVLDSQAMWSYMGADLFVLKKVMRLYEMTPGSFVTSFMLKLLGWFPKFN